MRSLSPQTNRLNCWAPPYRRLSDSLYVGDNLLFSFGHQVVRFCLQKNPKERPNCASLLSKKFFKRDLQPDGIVKELLVNVPVVGEGDGALERREPGCVIIIVLVCMSGLRIERMWFLNDGEEPYFCILKHLAKQMEYEVGPHLQPLRSPQRSIFRYCQVLRAFLP